MPIIGNPIYQSAFVVDQFSGNGSTVAFTMSVAPAGVTNVLVAVSGVLQDPSTYGVVGNTITFSAAPPSGTGNISCRYLGVPVTGVTTTAYRTVTEFTATASQTTFTPPSYTVGFINVYLNGVLLGSADYTASNGTTVVLATGASAGNLVTVESFQISSVLNAIPNTAGAVGASNLAAGAVTVTKLATTGTASSSTYLRGDMAWATINSSQWTTSGSNIYYTTGNVGIGTSSPGVNLEVKSGSSVNIKASSDGNVYSYLTMNTWALDRAQLRAEAANPSAGSGTGHGSLSILTANNTSLVERGRFDGSGNFLFNSGYGSVATAYGCRAWVNFNGNSYAIRGSGNVSSITNIATGINQINFTTAMPDTSYSVSGFSASGTLSNSFYGGDPWVGTTTYCYLWSNYANTSYNLDWCGVQVFR